ncbi:MAG: PilW family protein [Wenzhouxiangellaceae bacterium]|nr:PilW family protein [Wenzhouxiangellaceae bacterium]
MTQARHTFFSGRRARGLSLVELMVAITLALLLSAGMVQLFQGSKITFNTNDALARVQENGRFAMELIKREFRMAGTHGFCAAQLEIRNHLNQDCGGAQNSLFDARLAVSGWDYTGTRTGDAYTVPDSLDPSSASPADWDSTIGGGDPLPDLLEGLVVPGTDVLVLRRMDVVPGVSAVGNTQQNSNSINLVGLHNLPQDALVLVTNCANAADLFQNVNNQNATSFSKGNSSCSNPGPGNSNAQNWTTVYDDSMQAFQVVMEAFFIGADAEGNPGLYRLDMGSGTSSAVPEEVVRGAENLQLQYGFSRAAPVGDGQSIDDWVDATAVPADGWGQVLAIRVGLSMRSDERADLDETQQTFALAGVDVTTPGDARMRQPFSSTVALRNRYLVF